MEIRVLRYFLAVARAENITAAAESLYVTQPTLSKQLMELEKQLGTKLFVRGSRKTTLTEEGVYLRKKAQEIIDLVDKTQLDFKDTDDLVSGDIYIGGAESDAVRLIARTANLLSQTHPHIRYHLFSGNADDIAQRLDNGLLDFGLLIEPASMDKYDYFQLPTTDSWGLLMKKDHPLAQKEGVQPKDLYNLPLLASRQTLVENELSGWCGQDFERLNIVATYNLVFNASIMVDEGVGCALVLDKLVNTSSDSNLCFRPLEPKLEARLNIVWKKHQVFSRAAKLFIGKLQELCNKKI